MRMSSIGFDLDNTIIDYGLPAKLYAQNIGIANITSLPELRKAMNGNDPSGDAWTRAQSWIYGEGLRFADIHENLTTQITELQERSFSIFVISHKTEYGPKNYGSVAFVDLALEWLSASPLSSVLSKNENLFFEGTRELKLERIRSLNLDFFVDDLVEVLEDSRFPRETIGIHYCEDATSSKTTTSTIGNFSQLTGFLASYG